MTHRLRDVEHSCRIIDRTQAVCATMRQFTDDKNLLDATWTIDRNLEDIRYINDQLRSLAKEYIVMIEDLEREVDGCRNEINMLNTDIEDLEVELDEIKQRTVA